MSKIKELDILFVSDRAVIDLTTIENIVIKNRTNYHYIITTNKGNVFEYEGNGLLTAYKDYYGIPKEGK